MRSCTVLQLGFTGFDIEIGAGRPARVAQGCGSLSGS
jgi:hypothetical protein